MQRRHQAGHGQVDVDYTLKLATAKRIQKPGARVPALEGLEPPPVEADGNHDSVICDTLALIAVCDCHHHVVLACLDLSRPSCESAETAHLVERRLSLQREDATIGALKEFTPVRLGQARPVSRVGVEPVLVVALTA